MNLKEILGNYYFTPQRFIGNLVDIPAVVLIYHRVAHLDNDQQMLAVKPDNFFRQIEYLVKNYNVLTIQEFDFLVNKKKQFPKNSILITFDDGYADNATNALPILESLNAQGLFFITTSNIDTKIEMWWDKLDNVFFTGKRLPGELSISINNRIYKFNTSTEKDKLTTYKTLHPLIKFNKKNIRDSITQKLFEWASIVDGNREEYRMLSSEELLSMDKSPSAIIGAHTHTHSPLSILSYDEQVDEVKRSKEILENLLSHPINYFSYPFGNRKDYNQNSLEVCKYIGFNFVCANFYFQVHRWTNKFELPRALVRDWEFDFFKMQVNKFFKY